MLTIRLSSSLAGAVPLALPVSEADGDSRWGRVPPIPVALTGQLPSEIDSYLATSEHTGAAGVVAALPRPLQQPARVLLIGTGAGDEAGWRVAGAALARAATREPSLTVALPLDVAPDALRGLAEGLLLASYRYRLGRPSPTTTPALQQVSVVVDGPERFEPALARARVVAEQTYLARDLTNTPSLEKSPEWFAKQVAEAVAGTDGLALTVRTPAELAAEGFGGILAVGGGSNREPRLVELGWHPPDARRHIVLVGKGITFDSGGISIKTRAGMKLMKKDMAGAAAIVAATLGAARLDLPVQVTALAPLAENMPSGSAWRPGDVVRHYGGRTTEVIDTDAEGRVVLADALAYAADRLHPDVLVDLATLTGANAVALGKGMAALYSDDDELAGQLGAAAQAAGERVWRMPLADDYRELFRSDVADSANLGVPGEAGSVVAALYLREFTGDIWHWAHLDMSAPSWSESADGELPRGATGWGVRTLLRWLEGFAG